MVLVGCPNFGWLARCFSYFFERDKTVGVQGATLQVRGSLPDQGAIQPRASVPGTPVLSDGSYTIGSEGSGQNIYNTFKSAIDLSGAATQANLVSGSYTTQWQRGETGNVNMTANFWTTGLNLSMSLPPGVSGSVTDSEALYTNSQDGVKEAFMSMQGLTMNGALLSVNQNVTANWVVGTSSYTLETN